MQRLIYLLLLSILLLGTACEKEKITENISQLSFSTDTVIFDTVFTQIGTATRNFKVYNRGNGTLRIGSISLANPNSPFRINVDGNAGKSFQDIEILPNDSIFVFVEATINPNGASSPLIVSDSILFNINGNIKDVDLVAWGQDANYIRADQFIQGLPPFKILSPNEVWTNSKPYVIYGYAVVDSTYSLTIQAGSKIHFHSGSGLWVYRGGSIKVLGTKDQPVVFQGDRLEPFYKDLPGQWDRIWINEGTVDNVFNYAIIKNALIGLQIETQPFTNNINAPTSANKVVLNNCIIQNHSSAAVFARNFRIDATNSLIANGGQYSLAISGGGTYNFKHCTMANYFSQANRKTPAFIMSNAYEAAPQQIQVRQILNTSFTNCLFYGVLDTEFELSIDQQAPSDYVFENCLIKREEIPTGSFFVNNVFNKNPEFVKVSEFNFQIGLNSAAKDKGKSIGIFSDLQGNPRDDNPDIGAFEYKAP